MAAFPSVSDNKPSVMNGHSKPGRAVSLLLQASPRLLYLLQPSPPKEQNHQHEPNSEEQGRLVPICETSSKGVSERGLRDLGRVCVALFFLEASGGLPRIRSGGTRVLIYAQKPVTSRWVTIPPNSELLKGPQTGLVSFSSVSFSIVLPPLACRPCAAPLPSPVFLRCCPQQPQQSVLERREQARLPGSLAVVAQQFAGATQRTRFLCKPPCSSPPQRRRRLAGLERPVSSGPAETSSRHPCLTSRRHLFTNSAS